jgi:hypothetical protein
VQLPTYIEDNDIQGRKRCPKFKKNISSANFKKFEIFTFFKKTKNCCGIGGTYSICTIVKEPKLSRLFRNIFVTTTTRQPNYFALVVKVVSDEQGTDSHAQLFIGPLHATIPPISATKKKFETFFSGVKVFLGAPYK